MHTVALLKRAGWLAACAVLASATVSPCVAVAAPALSAMNGPDVLSGWRLAPGCEARESAGPITGSGGCGRLALDWEPSGDGAAAAVGAGSASAERFADGAATDDWPHLPLTSFATGFALVASSVTAFAKGPHEPFHFTQEGYFGQNTYAGGADKAAHFVNTNLLSKELSLLYSRLGYSEQRSRWMGFGVAALSGLLVEIGDGTTKYGFSYEDLVMDVLGAGSAALISAAGVDDLLGFRFGFLLPLDTDTCCQVHGLGHDYSNEIYTADFKIAGVAKRLGLSLGPLKYLLFSVTYGSKGYPTGLPEQRERLVGLEVGLNLAEILNDVGVRRDTWWGYTLHMIIDNVRFPYTAGGFRYDLNRGEWHGPTTR